jgi:hypothetical protein
MIGGHYMKRDYMLLYGTGCAIQPDTIGTIKIVARFD